MDSMTLASLLRLNSNPQTCWRRKGDVREKYYSREIITMPHEYVKTIACDSKMCTREYFPNELREVEIGGIKHNLCPTCIRDLQQRLSSNEVISEQLQRCTMNLGDVNKRDKERAVTYAER